MINLSERSLFLYVGFSLLNEGLKVSLGKGGNLMGKRIRIAVIMLLFLLVVVMLTSTNVLAAEKGREKKEKGKPLTYEPKVLSAINEGTTRVQVYVYSHTTLYIRNGSTLIAQRRYGRNGVKTVRIPRQKKGKRLSFQLRNNLTNLLGPMVYRTVERRDSPLFRSRANFALQP